MEQSIEMWYNQLQNMEGCLTENTINSIKVSSSSSENWIIPTNHEQQQSSSSNKIWADSREILAEFPLFSYKPRKTEKTQPLPRNGSPKHSLSCDKEGSSKQQNTVIMQDSSKMQ